MSAVVFPPVKPSIVLFSGRTDRQLPDVRKKRNQGSYFHPIYEESSRVDFLLSL